MRAVSFYHENKEMFQRNNDWHMTGAFKGEWVPQIKKVKVGISCKLTVYVKEQAWNWWWSHYTM